MIDIFYFTARNNGGPLLSKSDAKKLTQRKTKKDWDFLQKPE
jgi:hypothetical protein